MSQQIKSGLVGVIVGMVLTFGTIMLTTGSYKTKVDSNCKNIQNHETRISKNERDITGIQHDQESADEMLKEVRSDVKEILSKIK